MTLCGDHVCPDCGREFEHAITPFGECVALRNPMTGKKGLRCCDECMAATIAKYSAAQRTLSFEEPSPAAAAAEVRR